MNAEALQIIVKLGLKLLPREGGFYRLTWVSAERLASGRAAGSAIYFLITPDDFSALHRMQVEELWHFYAGDSIEHVQLDARDGSATTTRLGSDVLAGEAPQVVVPVGVWQGARLAPLGRRGWALLGCSLSPAWDEAEFELGDPPALTREFPAHVALVRELTR